MKFDEIENPWNSKKKDYDSNQFEYTLKEDDYYAERFNKKKGLYSMISKHKFENNKIYKLKYDINYDNGRFRVGFGNLGNCNSRLMETGSVGLTNEGLFIEGKKKSNIKIENENKEIMFIVNLKDKKKF